MPTTAIFAGTRLRAPVIGKVKPLAHRASANATAIVRSAGRCSFSRVLTVHLPSTPPRYCRVGDQDCGFSAMKPAISAARRSPWQQQDRVNRSAEKAAAHDRKGNPAERCVDHVLVEGVEPRLV